MVSAVPYRADMSKKAPDEGDGNESIAQGFSSLGEDIFGSTNDHIRERLIPGLLRSPEFVKPIKMPEMHFDRSPSRTADATEQMAEHTAGLLQLTQAALDLAESSKNNSDRVERFTRRMSWASFWVSVGSAIAALASLIVAIIAIAN